MILRKNSEDFPKQLSIVLYNEGTTFWGYQPIL